MNKLMIAIGFGTIVFAACNVAPVVNPPPPYKATLSGAAEKPTAVTTAGSGNATANVDGTTLTLKIDYSNLSGTPTLAHIHGPADESKAAGVLCDFTDKIAAGLSADAGSGTINATCVLDGSKAGLTLENLKAGLFYINVHTVTNKAGEVRGQLKLQ
jgi:CHRD domain